MTVSVVTLAKGRPDHLVNLVHGLTRQSQLPVELIVAVMQAEAYDLPAAPFPIRQMHVVADALLMGEVMYLPGGATAADLSMDRFAGIAVRHSDRRGPPPQGVERCNDYRCFWSLNFAMRRATFLAVGGFDERYVGYGGEDTDFGKTLDQAGVPIAWIKGGRAYHQYHPHHMPPVHHLDSVVRNAELFEAKWGYRTMGHWLHAFRLMGLVDDTAGRPVRILRRPGPEDFALTGQQSHQPYANTASVIRELEARAAEADAAAGATRATLGLAAA